LGIEVSIESKALTHVLLIRLKLQPPMALEGPLEWTPLQQEVLWSFAKLCLMELNKSDGGALQLSLERAVARREESRVDSYIYLKLAEPKVIDQVRFEELKNSLSSLQDSSALGDLSGKVPSSWGHPGSLNIELSRLSLLSQLTGSDEQYKEWVHYVVETDVQSGWWDEISQWYEEEHLPGLASVPGCLVARRYLNLDSDSGSGPRSFACYDLKSEDVLSSPPWLAVRATPWSSRARPHFVNTKRNVYPLVLL
jgi:hypothetical protein